MVTVQSIKAASSQAEVYDLVEKAAQEHDCSLAKGKTFLEQAEFFEEKASAGNDFRAINEILRAAESRWFELAY